MKCYTLDTEDHAQILKFCAELGERNCLEIDLVKMYLLYSLILPMLKYGYFLIVTKKYGYFLTHSVIRLLY